MIKGRKLEKEILKEIAEEQLGPKTHAMEEPRKGKRRHTDTGLHKGSQAESGQLHTRSICTITRTKELTA